MIYEEFQSIPSALAREVIMRATNTEILTGVKHPFSLQTIAAENRRLGLACRMMGKDLLVVNKIAYTGRDIANVYVESVMQNGKMYYPVAYDMKADIKSLVLFVKSSAGKTYIPYTYIPYARFDVEDVISTSTQPDDFNSLSTVPDFLSAFKYTTLLVISNVQTTNLPTDYLGVTSGVSVWERAFKGSSSSVVIV